MKDGPNKFEGKLPYDENIEKESSEEKSCSPDPSPR